MSANKRDARLKNLELARIKTETERIDEESASVAEKIEAMKLKLSKLKEERKQVESSSLAAKWKNHRLLKCRNCEEKCNTTTRKPAALKCRETMCLPCFWQIYVAERDNLQRRNLLTQHIGVTCPHCLLDTNMPLDLNEQDIPKSHSALQILEICESE